MFNNPGLYQNMARPGLLSRLFGTGAAAGSATNVARAGINWSTLLSNTQKSLGIINQAIPIVYQVKPIINNAKTMFRIAGAVKDDKEPTTSTNHSTTINNTNSYTTNNDNKPIFYI